MGASLILGAPQLVVGFVEYVWFAAVRLHRFGATTLQAHDIALAVDAP